MQLPQQLVHKMMYEYPDALRDVRLTKIGEYWDRHHDAGLVFQVVSLTIFVALCVDFVWQTTNSST